MTEQAALLTAGWTAWMSCRCLRWRQNGWRVKKHLTDSDQSGVNQFY